MPQIVISNEDAEMAKSKTDLIARGRIARAIRIVRGEKVMLDADLAALYGITTSQLNQQVRRNRDRFPRDFAFQVPKMSLRF